MDPQKAVSMVRSLPPEFPWMTTLSLLSPVDDGEEPEKLSLSARAVLDAWRLRTAGCAAIVFPWDDLNRLCCSSAKNGSKFAVEEKWNTIQKELRRMRRPVSAVDYPPSIFMVGEDELVTKNPQDGPC